MGKNKIGRLADALVKLLKYFPGKSDIKEAAKKEITTEKILNAAKDISGLDDDVKRASKAHALTEKYAAKATRSLSIYHSAKRNYDSTLSSVRKYSSLYSKAKRSRNSRNINRYSRLLSRAKSSLRRRKSIMDSAWDSFCRDAWKTAQAWSTGLVIYTRLSRRI